VVDVSEVRYAITADDVHIAYQVAGDSSLDLVFCPGFVTHLELGWEEPRYSAFLSRLASFSRLIVFDKRGMGLSDPVSLADPPTLEAYASDVAAVMDAAGSKSAALLGAAEGASIAILFAASFPDRIPALVLFNGFAKFAFPSAMNESRERDWGKGRGFEVVAPSVAYDEDFLEWAGRFERLAASPGTARMMRSLYSAIDVRALLPMVHVPTLVLHRAGNRFVGIEHGRYLAEHIPGARLIELAGDDHFFQVGDTVALLDEIEEFLTGVRRGANPDRVLSTIMFTDIVGSTEEATRRGDRGWRELLDRYDAVVNRQLGRFRGRQVKATGDGTLATFDGPARAVHCAAAIHDALRRLGLSARIGIHTGEIELRGDDIGGIAVHIAQRIQASAVPEEILVSSTVKELVAGSDIAFRDRGEHMLKGVPEQWHLFAVES
jgi:class 3 adenylate cyclase